MSIPVTAFSSIIIKTMLTINDSTFYFLCGMEKAWKNYLHALVLSVQLRYVSLKMSFPVSNAFLRGFR